MWMRLLRAGAVPDAAATCRMKRKPVTVQHHVSPSVARSTHLRILYETHDLIELLATRVGLAMHEVVDVAVRQLLVTTYARRMFMQGGTALPYFIMYIDDKPTYLVAAKDAEKAELGVRQQLLQDGVSGKKVKAVAAFDAKFEDFTRVTLLALNAQILNVGAILANAAQQAAAAGAAGALRRGR